MSITIPVHPGRALKDLLKGDVITDNMLSNATGFSEEYIRNIIHGNGSITEEFAHGLTKIFNLDAEFWMNLQRAHDVYASKVA